MKPRPRPAAPKPGVPSSNTFTDLGRIPISNRLGCYQSVMFYWGFYEPRYWRNYLHTHSFFEICYAYRGDGIFRIGGAESRVKTGDLFIAKPGEAHEIISGRSNPLGIYFWAYSLTRGRPGDSALPDAVPAGSSPVDALLDRFSQSTRSVVKGPKSIRLTLEMLTDEIGNRSPGFPTVIQGLTAKLLLDTARATVDVPVPAEQVQPRARTEAESIVATASRYIHDNLARPIAVRDVAAQVHLSDRHLGILFLQVKQTTVLDCITQTRMETAAHLLLNQHWPVKKVAAEVGYPDVRYFTTLFRKRLKMTPANFRRQGGTVFSDKL